VLCILFGSSKDPLGHEFNPRIIKSL
jgi:hypothetical protein